MAPHIPANELAGYHDADRLRGRLQGPMPERRQELFVHIVWATWDRVPVLTTDVQAWLWPVLGEQARAMGCAWAVVGGMDDHVHVLCALPATVAVADLVKHLKAWTGRTANQRKPDSLRWQGGYSVFSVSPDAVADVERYVRRQADHHANGTVLADHE